MSGVLDRLRVPQSTLLRSLTLALLAAAALFVVSELLSSYNDLQLASGGYYFVALAGLTVLTGLSGQISLGHGALMAVGAYTVALLDRQRALGARACAGGGGRRHRARRSATSAPRRRACAAPTSRARRSRSRSACRLSRTSTRTPSAARTA